MNTSFSRSFAVSMLICMAAAMAAQAQGNPPGLTVDPHYTVTIFVPPNGQYTAPDSIAVTSDRVYIGYGNGIAPDGSDGKSSNIVAYTKSGRVVHVYTVVGHNDGLKINPKTNKLWAMQNEDAAPNLVIIDPETGEQKVYTFGPTPHGGGYDDIVFRNGAVYFSASNPANNPNLSPAIVKAKFTGSTIDVSPVLDANAQAIDIVSGQTVTLNLQDPDSMTLDPDGNVLLDSQGDSELLLVRNPEGPSRTVIQVPLSSPLGTPQLDDTLFIPNTEGFVLVSDTPANIVYAIDKKEFAPAAAFSAALAGTAGFVGQLNMETGEVTPIVTGLQSPHGKGFVPSGSEEGND